MNKFFNKKNKPKTVKSVAPLGLLILAACDDEVTLDNALTFSVTENATDLLVASAADLGAAATSSFSLSGEDADDFELSDAGELSLKEAGNYEARDSYTITIDVTTTTPAEIEGAEPTITTTSRDFTVNVVNDNDPALGSLTLGGTAAQGSTLVADTTGIIDEDGVGAISYQWYRDGELVTGADEDEFTLTQSDVGAEISAGVSYVDGSGATEEFTSDGTAAVNNTNDEPTGVPSITGTLSQNRELSVNTSSIGDIDGLGNFSYQWNRDGAAIEGATDETYILDEVDVGATISITVSYTDGYGADESVVSAQTAQITKANDAPTGALTISGTPAEGLTLTLDTSTIADIDGVGAFSYVWIKDGELLTSETGATYTLTQDDVGAVFTASVSYVDGLGVAETLDSGPTSTIINVNDIPTGNLDINGNAEKGSTLTLDTSTIADEDGLGDFTITWLADGAEIAGALSNTYTLTESDVGASISAAIEYTDGQGTVEIVSSASTATVADGNDTSGFELGAQPRIVEVRSSVIDIGEQSNVPAPFASEAYDIYSAIYPSLTPYWWYAVRGMPHVTYKTDEGYVVLKTAMFQYHDSTELSPLVFVIDEGKNIVSANSFDAVEFESTFAYAEATVGGVPGTIVAEAAAELAGLPFTEWPYGNLWFSRLDENESLSLTPLLDVKSQWADVGVGDINLDGLDDIVAVHLGSYDGDWRPLRLYTQNDDGSFSKDNDFFKFLDAPSGVVDNHWGGHSVTVADLNGDGLLEIIEGTYPQFEIIEGTYNAPTEVPLFQIHSSDGGGIYHLEVAQPQGDHASLGLVDAQAADLDGDGDLDLVFKTEGLGLGLDRDILGNGFILYRNDGDFVFTDVTDEWSGHSLYTGSTFGITKVHVIDLDGDGSLDIFTEHYGPAPNSDYSSKNIGALIHLNDGTGHLEWQGDNPDLTVPGQSLKDGIVSHFLGVEQGLVDIMMVYPDQTVSVLTADLNFV